MFPDDLDSAMCNRTETCRGRDDAIEAALIEEYFYCFSRAKLNEKQVHALRRCMDCAVILAHTTVIPLVFTEALNELQNLHPVVRAVCTLFFRHLRHSWFSLENPRVNRMYEELCRFEIPRK